MTVRSDRLYREVLGWLAAAFCIRILFAIATPLVIDSADSILYLDAARTIAAGDFADVYPRIPLLYPALTALASFVMPDIELAGIAVSLIAGSVLIVPVYLLSETMHGRATARVAALTAALWPWLVDYSCRVAPEALYSTLLFSAVYASIRTARHSSAAMFVLPFLLAGVYLVRPEGIFIVIALLAGASVLRPVSPVLAARLAPSILLLIVLVPLQLWLASELAENTGITPRLSATSLEYSFIDRGGESILAAIRLAAVTIPVMLGPILSLLLIPGFLGRPSAFHASRMEWYVVVIAAAQFVAASLSTFAEPRYVMITVLALSLWSARGAVLVSRMMLRSPRVHTFRIAPVAAIALMMLAGLAVNIVPPMLGRMSYKPLEYKIAGRWMREHLEPGLILSRKPQVGFYAQMPTTGPAPNDSLDDIYARLIDANARYVVVDERHSAQMIPALKPLLDRANAPPWLIPLHADLSPYPYARIVIYKVRTDTAS